MRIPSAIIEKFQRLYKAAYGIDIDTEEAQKQLLAVMRLVAVRKERELSASVNCYLRKSKPKDAIEAYRRLEKRQ
jgi:hypothetical protein